jgi:transcriptional regulator with XRE-family HTH domain
MVEREVRAARLDRGLSQADLAKAVGIDRSGISRIERGDAGDLGIVLASEVLAAVGLELSLRAYPAAGPVRDAGHLALLSRFRALLHPSLHWSTEVPLPNAGDLRAWDGFVRGRDWRCGVEAETRPRDLQALQRRLALKARDGGVEWVILLLLGSRHNRALLREHGARLRTQFPVPGSRALQRLQRGQPPGGSAVILL